MQEIENREDRNILEVRNLHVSFRDGKQWREVVKGVNFSVKKGETLAIVGESGSGKSVSALSIMGLLDRKSTLVEGGGIWFEGKTDLTHLSEKELRAFRGKKIAMIFQEPMTSLNPFHRCGEQVMEMILQHEDCSKSEARERVLELFKRVKLPDVERVFSSYPHELSGGQKQRVMIAMAVSCKPDVLIADEPTTALDVSVQAAVLDLISSLRDEYGMGVVFISHDLGVVRRISDKVAVIYRGEIVEEGRMEDVFLNPKHPYTKGLLACRPSLDVRPRRLATVEDFLTKGGFNGDNISKEERECGHRMIYSQEPILQVRGLSVEYEQKKKLFSRGAKTFRAVDGISFDLYRGETLGLVGESGCGKSTLGRALMFLTKSRSESLVFEGRSLGKMNPKALKQLRKDIQIIFQDPYSSLNPRIPIGKAIEAPLKDFDIEPDSQKRKAQALEMMNKVGLSENFYSRFPHQLSGGQRQRVGIARALVVRPKIVVCDESVSALDVSIQAQVMNLLSDLKASMGLTYLFISHDLAVVKYFSDRILVMQKGSIVQSGEADEVFSSPQDEYTRMLVGSVLE